MFSREIYEILRNIYIVEVEVTYVKYLSYDIFSNCLSKKNVDPGVF